jgi:hypothetical protein
VTALVLLVMVLSVARLTRLATTDEVTEPLRRRVAHGSPDPSWPTRLLACDWCVSVWAALVASLVAKWTGLIHSWTWAGWSWPASAMGAGLLLRWS